MAGDQPQTNIGGRKVGVELYGPVEFTQGRVELSAVQELVAVVHVVWRSIQALSDENAVRTAPDC